MPVLIPTPDELRSMPWSKRKAAKQKIRDILLTVDPHGYRKPRKPPTETTVENWAAWGEAVRDDARTLMQHMTIDPAEAQRNQITLLGSIK